MGTRKGLTSRFIKEYRRLEEANLIVKNGSGEGVYNREEVAKVIYGQKNRGSVVHDVLKGKRDITIDQAIRLETRTYN